MIEPSWKTTARTITLSIILGAGAGVLGTALTTQYLSNYAVGIGELTAPLRLAEARPRAFPQSYEDAVSEVSEKIRPGLVSFFPATNADAFLERDAVLHGAVLTSDGWILTIPEKGTVLTSMHVLVGHTMYAVEQVVPDVATGASFVKIDADNLPVLAFGDGRDVIPAEQVFALPLQSGMIATSVVGDDWGEEALWSSDYPRRRIELLAQASSTLGAPVANGGGELIGFVSQKTDGLRYLPLESVLPAFNSLLKKGKIERASLGISTIDLSRALLSDPEQARGLSAGALVPSSASLIRGGAASEAGLLAGDIVLSVNGQLINGKHSLDEYVTEFEPGDVILLLVDRGGEQVTVEVPLSVL